MNEPNLFLNYNNIIKNDDKEFAKSIELDYYFEQVQNLRICVVDIDNSSDKLSQQDIVGETRASLAMLVGASEGKWTKDLHTSKTKASRGQITVLSEEIGDNNSSLFITFTGSGLDKKDFFGKS